MPPTVFIGSSSSNYQPRSRTFLPPTIPAGTQPGDLLLLPTQGTGAVPGWQLLGRTSNTSDPQYASSRLALYWRQATGSDPIPDADYPETYIAAYRGPVGPPSAYTGDVPLGSSGFFGSSQQANYTIPSLSFNAPASMFLVTYGAGIYGPPQWVNQPAGWTLDATCGDNSGSGNFGIGFWHSDTAVPPVALTFASMANGSADTWAQAVAFGGAGGSHSTMLM